MSQGDDPLSETTRSPPDEGPSRLLSRWGEPATAGAELLGETKRTILESLLLGDRTAEEMARMLDVNINAVRGHTDFLEREGFVQSRFEKARMGRPKKFYSITDLGRELFPRRYDALLISLINTLKSSDGKLVERAVGEMAAGLGGGVRTSIGQGGEKAGKEESLNQLDKVLNQIGFRTRLEIDENDGSTQIVRTDCPVIKVARSDARLICELFDTAFLRSALGSDVSLVQTMARGSGRCVHRVNLTEARTNRAWAGPADLQTGREG